MATGITLAVLAAVALAIELLSATFYLVAVAVALAAGSIAAFVGTGAPLTFAVVAFVAILSFPLAHVIRKRFARPTQDSLQLAQPDAGHLARIEAIAPDGLRVAYRDTSWQARLAEGFRDVAVAQGDHLEIVGRDGNELLLAPIPAHPKNKT